MRRVLLIAFAYPPMETVGSRRPAALAKYLPRFGWEPIVITPRMEGVYRQSKLIIETEYRDVLEAWKARLGLDRKRGVHDQLGIPLSTNVGSELLHTRLLNFARYLLTYPDPCRGWIPFALEALQEISRQKMDIAAIVTTSPPISTHLIGRRAKNILGCPWIADFRDLWTQNLGVRNFQHLQVGLERRTLKDADVLVTVSEPWCRRLQELHRDKTVCTIANGFDPDDYCFPPPALTREFSITYTGQLYEGQRDPTILFEVVRDLIDQKAISGSNLRIRFYGAVEAWLPVLVEKYGLNTVVELCGRAPRKEAMEHQRESQILLLLPWRDPRETGHHSAKLFEYLAAERPILAVGGTSGVLTEALRATGSGVHASSQADVRKFLLTSYDEFKKNGRVSYSGDRQAIGRYSHPEMARRFAEVLDNVAVQKDAGSTHTAVTLQPSSAQQKV